MCRLRALLLLCCSASTTTQAHAGAWTQESGKGLLAVSGTYYSGDRFFDNSGNKRPQSHYRKQETSAYGEWGISDDLTIGANLFLSHAEQSGKHNYSLNNPEFFVRRRAYHDDTRVVSVQSLIKLPTFAYRGRGPQSGNEATEAELALLYGQSLKLFSDRDFIDMAVAIRTRSDGLSAQWRSESKYGIGLTDNWTLVSALYLTQSITLDTPGAFREGGDLDYHLSKLELSTIYNNSNDHYWQLSGFDHIAGKQTGAGYGISITRGMRF